MSWNLFISKATESDLLPMGAVEEVSSTLSANFPGLVWPNRSRCELNVHHGFSIQMEIRGGNVYSLFTNGGYNHLKLFASICKQHDWSIFDPQIDKDMDLDDPYSLYTKSTQS